MPSGTFTGTGATAAISIGGKSSIVLDFTGTATVDIQVQGGTGTWVTAESKTADYVGIIEGPLVMRLNCSAYTNDVIWSVTP